MDRPLKILYVNSLDDPAQGAGAERSIDTLMRAVQAQGHDVAIAATCGVRGIHRHDRAGIRVWRAGLRNLYLPRREVSVRWPLRRAWHLLDAYNRAMARQLDRILAIEQPDVVSLHNLSGWSVSALDIVTQRNIPAVQVLHDYYNICPNSMCVNNGRDCTAQCRFCRFLRPPRQNLYNRAKAVVGVSAYLLNRHLAFGYYGAVPVQAAIHNARSAEVLRVGAPASPRLGNHGGVRFGFIGTIAPHKGIEQLLEAFVAIAKAGATLVVAGSGKAEYVEALRGKYQAAPVEFIGQVRPDEFFNQVDVTVIPSLWQEPLGMTVAESLAFGVPVVASRRGGIPEMVDHGVTGLLFEPDDQEELRHCLGQLADDPAALKTLHARAGAAGEKFLDTAGWAKKYLQIYRDAMAS